MQDTSPDAVTFGPAVDWLITEQDVCGATVCIFSMLQLSLGGVTGARNDSPEGSSVVATLAGRACVSQPGGATAALTSSIAMLC